MVWQAIALISSERPLEGLICKASIKLHEVQQEQMQFLLLQQMQQVLQF